MNPDQRAELKRVGCIPSGHAPVTLKLIEEARQHLLLRAPMKISCPVRLLQGMQDNEVPWQHALRITEKITQDDVRVTLIKDGDHRLSRPQDLEILWQIILEFID
jgi:esterase/lipase